MTRPRSDPGRRVTLKAVARHAGVSVSTASIVFSGKGAVAEATRTRVLGCAEELGYTGPDPLAASLRRGRAGAVAVIVEDRLLYAFRDPYAVACLDGLAAVLDDLPTGMLLLSQPLDDPSGAVPRFAAAAVDAVVFLGCGPESNPLVEHARSRNIPMVALGSPVGDDIVQIGIDEAAAMTSAARHVRDLGHTRVAHVALPARVNPDPRVRPLADLADCPFPNVRGRLLGLSAVYGPATPTVEAPTADIEGGHAAGGALLDLPGRPTAILAQSDLMAIGVVRAAHDRGLDVPGDLSVTGFDGIAAPWWPGELTTVAQPASGKGQAAGRAVQALLESRRPADVVLPTTLRVGASTGPAPPAPRR